jgi:YVTN family beta-propeller protein
MRPRQFTRALMLVALGTFTVLSVHARAIDPYLLVMANKLKPNKATHQEKLYISNEQSNTLTVVDVATNKVINTIVIGETPHGLAAAPSGELLYAGSEGDGSVRVIDTITDKVVKTYPFFGYEPNEFDISEDGRYLVVPSYMGYYQIFDTQKEEIVEYVHTKGVPHNTIVAEGNAYLFPTFTNEGHLKRQAGLPITQPREITIVSLKTLKVVGAIPIPAASRPPTISPDGKRLYVQTGGPTVYGNLMGFLVIDIPSRKVISQAEHILTPEEKAGPGRSHGITVAAGGREVWSADVNHKATFVFDVTVLPPKQIARIPMDGQPYWATTSLDGNIVYVAASPDHFVVAYDAATKKQIARFDLPKMGPKRMLAVNVPRKASSTTTTSQ